MDSQVAVSSSVQSLPVAQFNPFAQQLCPFVLVERDGHAEQVLDSLRSRFAGWDLVHGLAGPLPGLAQRLVGVELFVGDEVVVVAPHNSPAAAQLFEALAFGQLGALAQSILQQRQAQHVGLQLVA